VKRGLLILLVLWAVSAAMEPAWPRPIELPVNLPGQPYLEDYYWNDDYTFIVLRLEGTQGTGASPFTKLRPLVFQLRSDAGTVIAEYVQELPGELRGFGNLISRIRLRFAGHAAGTMRLLTSFYKNPDDYTEVELGQAGTDLRPWATIIADTKGFPLVGGYVGQYLAERQMPLAKGDHVEVIDRDKGLWQGADGKWVNAEVLWVIAPDGRVLAVRKEDLELAAPEPVPDTWEVVSVMVQAFTLGDVPAPVGEGWRKGTRLTDLGETQQFQGGDYRLVRDPDGLEGWVYLGSKTDPAMVMR
jgi:hypothetical protein